MKLLYVAAIGLALTACNNRDLLRDGPNPNKAIRFTSGFDYVVGEDDAEISYYDYRDFEVMAGVTSLKPLARKLIADGKVTNIEMAELIGANDRLADQEDRAELRAKVAKIKENLAEK